MGAELFDSEGRAVTIEYSNFLVVNTYFPSSKHGLTRLGEKLEFNGAFENRVEALRETKQVLAAGSNASAVE
jgi:exodeoxyribonuclease-3